MAMWFALTQSTHAARVLGCVVAAIVCFRLNRSTLLLGVSQFKRALAVIGVTAACASLLIAWVLIWDLLPTPAASEIGLRWMYGLGSFAFFTADCGMIGSLRLRRAVDRAVSVVAIASMGAVSAVVIAAAIDVVLVETIAQFVPWPLWVVGVTGAITAHAALPILNRMEVKREKQRLATLPDRAHLTLQCPRCMQWLHMQSGSIACPGCKLILRIEFEEPRCSCGYPLHRLSGEHCPECGSAISPEQRWGHVARDPIDVMPPTQLLSHAAPESQPISPAGSSGP